MKVLLSMFPLAIALAFIGPAYAQDITEADCAKAGGMWNGSKCVEQSAKMGKEEGTHEGANLGATPESDTQKIDQPARKNPTTSNAPQ